jgi:hypothetical protein
MKRCGMDASDLEWSPMAGCCENGNEPFGLLKGGNLLTS